MTTLFEQSSFERTINGVAIDVRGDDHECVHEISGCAKFLRDECYNPEVNEAADEVKRICREYGVKHAQPFPFSSKPLEVVKHMQALRSKASTFNNLSTLLIKTRRTALLNELRLALGVLARWVNQLPSHQMDVLGEPLMALAGTVVEKGLETLTGALKKSFGVDHDSRAIVNIGGDAFATVDLPREVSSLAFKKADRMPDQSTNYSQDVKVDVCDLKSRCMVGSRLATAIWARADPVGTDILGRARAATNLSTPYPVQPWEPADVLPTTGFWMWRNTALSAVGLMYERWRGSLKFTIEVLPTRFHQGQLYVAFQPWDGTGAPAVTAFAEARNCIGATIDLSTSNRTELIIPYNSTYEYLTVPSITTAAATPTYHNSLGQLYIYVQNPIVGPNTVATDVDVNVWISAEPDFEYVIPRNVTQQILVNGAWQMEYSEVIQDVKVRAPTALQPTGHVTETEKQVAAECNVRPADLITVTNREYLLATGVVWTTSNVQGVRITNVPLTTLFRQNSLAIRGLLDYHNYFRGDFEITLKMNANPFMQGMLAFTYIPAERDIPSDEAVYEVMPTLNQKACAFYTPATDTSATIKIPWTNIRRVIRTTDFAGYPYSLGSVLIVVYNQLMTGVAGPPQLTGSLWGRVLEPYVGFKKALPGTTAVIDVSDMAQHEMEEPVTIAQSERTEGVSERVEDIQDVVVNDNASSDSQTLRATGGRPVPLLKGIVSGYLQTSHMNAKELMRRPDVVQDLTEMMTLADIGMKRRLVCPVGVASVGRVHQYLRSSYHAWSGTMRYLFASNPGHTQEVLLGVTADFASLETVPQTTVVTVDKTELYNASVLWRPANEGVKIVSVPYYARFPTLYTPSIYPPTAALPVDAAVLYNGAIHFFSYHDNYLASASDTKYSALVLESIGDDFEFYLPMPFPPSRYPRPSEDVAVVDVGQSAQHECGDGEWDGNPQSLVFHALELQLEDVCSQLQHQGLLAGLTSTIDKLVAWIKKKLYAPAVREFSNKVRHVMEVLTTQVLPAMTWILDFLLNIHIICNSWDKGARAMALVALTTKCLVGYSWGDRLLTQLNEVIDIHFEMDSGTYAVIAGTVATAAVAGVIGLLGYGLKKSDARNIRELTLWKISEGASMFGKIASGVRAVPSLWTSCKTALQTAISYVIEGDNVFLDWYERNKEELQEWQIECDKCFVKDSFGNNHMFKDNNYTLCCKLGVMARAVKANGPGVKLFPQIYYRTADKILEREAAGRKAFDVASARVEPVGILVEGDAGCGKSFLWNKYLPYFIMKEAGLVNTAGEAELQTYPKPSDPNQQYLDGYMSQRWMSCDDFMAGTEDLDALQMINLISVAACPVNMADISEKKTTFDSVFICATTNQKCVRVIQAVRDKSAIIRRFPFAYHMRVYAPEIGEEDFRIRDAAGNATTKIDMGKVANALEALKTIDEVIDKLDKIWEFLPLDLATGSLQKGSHKARDVIMNIADLYRKRTKTNDRFDKMLASYQSPGASISVPVELMALRGDVEDDGIELGKTMFDAACELGVDEELSTVHVLKYYMEAWRLQQKAELTRAEAQKILRSIKLDVVELGFKDWTAFTELCGGVSPPRQSDADTYTPDGTKTKFCKFAVMLANVKSDIYNGPPKKKWEGLTTVLGAGVMLCGGALLVSGVVKLLRVIYNKVFANLEWEGPQYEKGNSRQPHHVRNARPVPVSAAAKAMQQGEEEPSDVVLSIQRAMRVIQFVGEKTHSMTCIALDNRTLLIPHHFIVRYAGIGGDVIVQLEKKDRNGGHAGFDPIKIERGNYEKLSDISPFAGARDCVVVKLVGIVCQHARNIRPLVVTRSKRDYYRDLKMAAWWLHPSGIEQRVNATISFENQIQFQGDLALPAKTAVQSVPGDCGRPYVLRNKNAHKALLGFHVLGFGMGTRQTGVCDFTLESIEEAEEVIAQRMYCAPAIEPWELEEAEVQCSRVGFWKHEMEVVGRVSLNGEKLERHQPTDTAFSRTKLQHGDWTDDYLPTEKDVVDNGLERIHPLYTNVQKFVNKMVIPPKIKLHRQVVEYMKQKIGIDEESRVLTEYEMINGFGSMSPIVISTGCGYMQRYFHAGKTEFFDVHEEQDEKQWYSFSEKARDYKMPLWGRTFLEHLDDQEERIRQGMAVRTFWVATNKDELVSRVKARVGKTRVFVQPGLELTLLVRKYFGNFLDNYKQRAGFNLCHGIGMDKDAVWGQYFAGLREVGENGFDVDYENYDGTVHGYASEAFAEVVDHYYCGAHSLERSALVDCIVNSAIITGREVVLKTMGNCSGSPITDVYNSITNWYNVLFIYLISKEVAGLEVSLSKFDEEVRCLTYGDDVIISATDETLNHFNRLFFKEVAAILGMSVTSAAKTGEIVPFEPITNLTFLKSPFVQRNGYIAAPLPVKVIHRELRWQKKINDGNLTILEQKVNAALEFMAHHGRDAVTQLLVELGEVGYPTTFDFDVWEWNMRSKQEVCRIDGVWKRESGPELLFLKSDDHKDNLWDFDVID